MKKFARFVRDYFLGFFFIIYFTRLPQRMEKFIFPLMDRIALQVKNVFLFLSQIVQESYLISGQLDGADATILYIGNRVRLPYILKLVGLHKCEVRKTGRVYFENIRKRAGHSSGNADIVLAETGNFFSDRAQAKGFCLIPEWVKFVMPVPDSVEELDRMMNKYLKNEMRKIRKYSYSYETTSDPDKLSFFYHRMHVPYISKRHAYLPYIHDLSLFKRVLKKGAILFVKGGGDYLGGNVVLLRNGTPWIKWAGVIDGDPEYLRKGVRGASDYFAIKWAVENGFETIDFGLSRAFFSDGVFHFKKKWGMELCPYSLNSMFFGLRVFRDSEGVKKFLARTPFVFYRDGRLEGFVAVPGEYQNMKGLTEIQRRFMIPGITRLNLLCCEDNSGEFRKVCEGKRTSVNCIEKDFFLRHE